MKAFISALILLTSVAANAQHSERSVFGKWKITRVADSQDTTSISDEEAAATVGMELRIGEEGIRFGNANCARPVFKTAKQRFYSYFVRQYNFEPKKVRLPDHVLEVQVKCEEPVDIGFFYVRDRDHLVFYWQGFFLDARRQRPNIKGDPDRPR